MTGATRRRAWGGSLLWALAALLGGGCSASEGANPNAGQCSEDTDCAGGEVCHRGFCVAADGSVSMDAAIDGSSSGCVAADGTELEEGARHDCYTGEEGEIGVGECRPGEQECRNGELSACLGQVLPGLEVCNGDDDDCDGIVDEFNDMSCSTGMEGVCAEGEMVCRGMDGICEPVTSPTAETCNGDDDDCDGTVDEDSDRKCYPADTDGCTQETDGTWTCRGICTTGTQACTEGAFGDCSGATLPAAGEDGCTTSGEVAQDDDCDGMTDEDCPCTDGESQSCYSGPDGTAGVGACRQGYQQCEGGSFGACVDEVTPTAESCGNQGVDDDCNGTLDDIEGLGEPCVDDSAKGVCRNGTMQCDDSDSMSCVTPEPSTETCNGKDDDCDGSVDEDFDLLGDESNCGACGNSCGDGLTCCGGSCVDTDGSELHCGACGESCGEGLTCCSGSCADTTVSTSHCGGCGVACGADQQCCGGSCTDTQTDTSHCGDCGTSCDAGQLCCAGKCRSECSDCNPECGGSEECCSQTCTDTSNDEANCGSCGEACAMGQLCCGGGCVPNDRDNCGSCGNDCGDGELCCGGSCVPESETNCGSCGNSCESGQLCCGGGCVPSDTDNCGSCGNDCASGQLCCSGSCVQSDPSHCGSCEVSCDSGQLCCDGGCVPSDTDNCGSCGNDCATDELCCDDTCVPNDKDNCNACGTTCAGGRTCCASGCTDTDRDRNNCGECGNDCSAGETCRSGTCCLIADVTCP